MQTLLTIGIFQFIFSLFLIFDRGPVRLKESPMIILLIFLSFHFTIKGFLLYVLHNEYMFHYFATCFNFAYGPLILDFVRIQYQKKRLNRLHFFPALFFGVIYLFVGAMTLLTKEIMYIEFYRSYVVLLMFVSLFGYFSYLFFFLLKQSHYPAKVLKGMIPIFGTVVFFLLFSWTHLVPDSYLRWGFYICFITLAVQYLRYELGVRKQVQKWKSAQEPMPDKEVPVQKVEKYERSALTPQQAQQYVRQLEALMTKQKIFLNQELSLADLSEKTGIPKHHLSESLNLHLGKNFYQFVNEYRIREAMRLIEENPGRKLLHLAFDCGFNTKATFNAYFKKMTGHTPSHYRMSARN
ncbi:helix-turn-helix domain-containing protein [Persicobacter sp. CCB-QB2]|uniref:AraC family transcriptional regulator n=1 Tax=Persicobacter sp. CCB-QB2 TaxID=1561025 RepID=UPI0006A9F3DB|nr:helix-turn-helix domain-containing protein [Persicobacter sp. CCB-QB2]